MNLIAETERLLSALVAMADVKVNPPWRQAIAIESLRAMCVDADPALLRAMFVRYDTGTSTDCGGVSIFQGITDCMGRIVQTSLEERGAVAAPVKLRLLEMLASQEPPGVTNFGIVWDALDGVTGVVDGLALLLSRVLCGDDIGDEQGKRVVRRGVLPVSMPQERWEECAAKPDFSIIVGMADTAWPGLLAALSLALKKCNDDDVLQQVLKCYQTIVHACAILQLYTPRDAFLTSLCKEATPRGGFVTLKNVAAAKTLFNIAFCLPDLIQSAWPLLVDMLDCLDKTLPLSDARSIPTPTAQSLVEGDGGGQAAPLPELIIVRTALDNLFQHTSTYNETTVFSIIDSLAALCKAFFTSVTHDDVSTARSPPLDRICDILKHNVSRVTSLWPFYLRVTMDAAQAAPAHIRSLVVKKFSGVVVTTLRHHLVENPSPTGAAVEVMVLRSLESFNAMSSHVDVRSSIVACILALLQSCGQALSEGWPVCLSIVKAVAVDGELSLMVKAFQSVQLVQSDFLMDLPVDCLQLLVTSVAAFGQQTADTNIALTAVGLLWNIGDFFARESNAIKFAFMSEERKSVAACQLQMKTSDEAIMSSSESSSPDEGVALLWRRLLREMRQLCMDPRPEVRHCCLRSLSTTVQVHGAALHATGTWEFCLWDILFPLLVDVQECSAQAILKEQSAGARSIESDSLGLDKGKAVPLLVHHTRDTALKQWSETRVLVFHAVCRLVGVFSPYVSSSNRSDVACSTVLDALAAAATSNTQEVAVSALQAFSEFASSVASVPRTWWPLIWAALGKVIDVWQSSNQPLIFPAVEELVNLLVVLQPLGREHTSSSDSAKLAASVSGLLRLQDSSKAKGIALMQQPSSLHTKTLNWLVAAAAPGCMPEVAHAVLSSLCDYIPAAPLTDSASAVDVIVAAAVCNAVGQIIQAALPPPSVLSTLCLSVTQRLLVAASDRQRDIRSKLSFEGSSALLAMVSLCLPQLHAANHDALVAVWEVACGGLGSIILGALLFFCFLPTSLINRPLFAGNYDVEVHENIQDAVSLCEAADLRAVQVCVDLLPLVTRDPQRLCRPLLHVFDAGVAHITSLKGRVFKRERLASTCMQILFDCAHGSIGAHGEIQELVSCATVVVARRFRDILHRLQVDSDAAGICPLPKYRISQVCCRNRPARE